MTDVAITEFEEIDPDELHLVGKGANGFKALLAKSASDEVREVLETIASATDTTITAPEREPCDACADVAKASETCKKCFGTKLLPRLGETPAELMVAAKASAASGAPVPVKDKCPTCLGTGYSEPGTVRQVKCVDCNGTGKDSTRPTDNALNTVDAGGPDVKVGAGGRETVDKSSDIELCEDDDCTVCKEAFGDDLEKAKLKGKTRNALPDSAFALPGRRYPIHDESHARNALARVSQNGTPDEKAKVRAAVKRKYPNIQMADASKGALDGSVYSAPNPALGADVAQGVDPATGPTISAGISSGGNAVADSSGDPNRGSSGQSSGDASTPGSPAWEACDADIATNAATALMAAAELIRTFANREGQEVAAGEGNDLYDAYDASSALCSVNDALGVMARLAFHEGLEASKSLEDNENAEKAGKRLSTKSVSALAAARDQINDLLGEDDPSNSNDNDDATEKSVTIDMDKLSEELKNMETDELTKVLDAREDKLVGILAEAFAKRGVSPVQDVDNTQSIGNAKGANSKGKNRKKKVASTDDVLEDEAATGNSTTANTSPSGAAKSEGDETVAETEDDEEVVAEKAELTPEEIEAKQARKDAKKALRKAEKAEKEAAESAAMRKAIEEATSEVRKANEALQERLEQVEKMAAPSTIVRTAPADAQVAAKARDDREMHLAALDRKARESNDPDVKKAAREEARELRATPVA